MVDVPISTRTIVQRINRKLAHSGQTLSKARGRNAAEIGWHIEATPSSAGGSIRSSWRKSWVNFTTASYDKPNNERQLGKSDLEGKPMNRRRAL